MQQESISGPLSPTELKASDEDTFYLFPKLNNSTKALITQRVTVSYDREQISINCPLRKVLTRSDCTWPCAIGQDLRKESGGRWERAVISYYSLIIICDVLDRVSVLFFQNGIFKGNA